MTAGAAGILNAVTVSGTVKDTNGDKVVGATTLAVTVGKDIETLTVNTAVETTLQVVDGVGKKVSTVNAASSAGAVTYVAGATVANIATGAGADTVTLNTVFTADLKSASLNSGDGDDTLNVLVDNDSNDIVGATVSVNAGAGNDKITVNTTPSTTTGTLKISIDAGAGNDTVILSDGFNSVKTTDVVDGGAGVDTVVGAGQTTARVADDYITLTKVIKNFEAIQFTSAEGAVAGASAEVALDASLLANYKTFTFDAVGVIKNVAADQTVVLNSTGNSDNTVTAKGYVSKDTAAFTAVTATTYAGTLNIQRNLDVAGSSSQYNDIVAKAENVNLAVSAVDTEAKGFESWIGSNLYGDAKSVTVTLTNAVDKSATGVVQNQNVAWVNIDADINTSTNSGEVGAFDTMGALTSVTLKGDGEAYIYNYDGAALVTVDASKLGGKYAVDGVYSGLKAGDATYGLYYSSENTKAETIILGSGFDYVDLRASTYGKVDTVTGLNLILNDAKTALVSNKSDELKVGGVTSAVKFTTTQTDLDVALLEAAQYKVNGPDADTLVFQMGGNTYIYKDIGTANQVDSADTLVKLTGLVDLDALIVSLG